MLHWATLLPWMVSQQCKLQKALVFRLQGKTWLATTHQLLERSAVCVTCNAKIKTALISFNSISTCKNLIPSQWETIWTLTQSLRHLNFMKKACNKSGIYPKKSASGSFRSLNGLNFIQKWSMNRPKLRAWYKKLIRKGGSCKKDWSMWVITTTQRKSKKSVLHYTKLRFSGVVTCLYTNSQNNLLKQLSTYRKTLLTIRNSGMIFK